MVMANTPCEDFCYGCKGDARAWCSREPLALEYLFADADYAAEHYDRRARVFPKSVPAACEKCCDALKVEREREESGRKK